MKGSLIGWWRWAIVAVLIYVGIVFSNDYLPVTPTGLWLRAGEYALWATVTLGAIARFYPILTPYGWRPVTIFIGAVLSGLEIFVGSGPANKVRVDEWMTALIGIAVITILARVLPAVITRIWFGQEVVRREPFTRTPR
jgi:xanthine/uracil permease